MGQSSRVRQEVQLLDGHGGCLQEQVFEGNQCKWNHAHIPRGWCQI